MTGSGNHPEYFGKHHAYLLPQDNYYTRKVSNALRDALELRPEQSILELGCGAGRFSIPLLDQGFSMTCVDTSKELVDVFQKHLKPSHRAKVACQDLHHLEGQFDVVLGFFVLHHFNEHGALLEKIKKLLKPGGRVGFVEPNPFNLLYYVAPLFYGGMSLREEYYFVCDRDRLKRNFKAAGFRNAQVDKFGFLPPQIINLGLGPKLDEITGCLAPKLCHLVKASL